MNNSERTIARRYARAFLNTFSQVIKDGDIQKFESVAHFLEKNKGLSLFLKIGIVSYDTKLKAIKKALEKFGLSHPWDHLVEVLIKNKHIFLFSLISFYVKRFYFDLIGIVQWEVASSSKLEQGQIDQIEKLLAKKTGKKALCKYSVDHSLIAGIRMKSDELLWEYSVEKKLCILKALINS